MKNITQETASNLTREYGSPLFVFSAEKIRNNLSAFTQEFENLYKNIAVSYSYKVNCLPGILDVIHEQGAWAEVASGHEYRAAELMGVAGERIIFNGPLKTKDELIKAAIQGAYINVDHLEELKMLECISLELEKPIDIGIRINTEVGIEQLPDRFGFNLESGEAEKAVMRCIELKRLNVRGIHIHLTSYILESDSEDSIPARGIKLIWPKGSQAYSQASRKVANFARTLKQEYGLAIKYIDMGGGFPTVDSLGPYAEAITAPIKDEYSDDPDPPLLILEPGRAIVSDAGVLIVTVAAVKELTGGRRAVVTDAGINILPTSLFKYQDIEILSDRGGELRDSIIYGPLCLQTDIISRLKLRDLQAGDILLVKNVGTYNIPQSSSFIFEQPAVVMNDGKEVKVLREIGTV